MTNSERCAGCGGLRLQDPTGPAYDHAPDCRIGRRVVEQPTYAATLKTPGEQAILAWGGLMMRDGLDEEAAWAKLTPEQQRLAAAEMRDLKSTFRRARR